MRAHAIYMVILIWASLGLCACAPLKLSLAHPTPSAALKESLATLTSEPAQTDLKQLLGMVDARKTANEVARGAVGGTLDELATEQRKQQTARAIDDFVRDAMKAVAKGTKEDIGPALRGELEKVLRSAATTLLSTRVRQDVSGMASAATRGALHEFAVNTREDIGPSVAHVVEYHILPSVGEGITNEVAPALETAAHDSAYGAGLGLANVLDNELGASLDAQVFAKIRNVGDMVDNGAKDFARALMVIIGVLILTLMVLGYLLRAHVARSRRHADALDLVTTSIALYYASKQAGDLIEIVKQRSLKADGEKSTAGAWLSDFIDNHPHRKAMVD